MSDWIESMPCLQKAWKQIFVRPTHSRKLEQYIGCILGSLGSDLEREKYQWKNSISAVISSRFWDPHCPLVNFLQSRVRIRLECARPKYSTPFCVIIALAGGADTAKEAQVPKMIPSLKATAGNLA